MSRRAARPAAAGVAAALLAMTLSTTLVGCGAIPTPAAGGERNAPLPAPVDPSASSSTPASEPGGELSEPEVAAPPAPPPVTFKSNVKDGKGNVKVSTLVSVQAANGSLRKVSLAYRGVTRQGRQISGKIKGTLSADRTNWTATERLEPSSTYTLTASGKNTAGASATDKSSFRTAQLMASQETYATLSPGSGSVVGMGMPAVLTFDVPVRDKAAFEENLHVETTPKQVGTWSWLSDTEVRYRPKRWWKPGTKVKVWADINGLAAGNGVYGQMAVSTDFKVSKTTLLTRINLKTHRARVYINGEKVRTIPISAGKSGWSTRSGTKLIMGKRPLVNMTGESIGIREGSREDFDLNVRWAMQVTATGEYLHAAPWNSGYFGRANRSHGCVGMSTSNAIWLYNRVRAGDPVITTGSNNGLNQGNGYADWNISYKQFKKGSAL
jgi:lipoprotein-anchoring transpeptidase ErfK/SrfK